MTIQHLTYQQQEKERLRLKKEKYGGLTDSNLSALPKRKGLTAEQLHEQIVAKERAMRPKGWTSIAPTYTPDDAVARQAELDREFRSAHLLRSKLPLMWQEHSEETKPNIYLHLVPELGIEKALSGAFTLPNALQTWVDQHPDRVIKAISTELNKIKKLTPEQKELNTKLQNLI
jgi:cell division septum initiation protein DivIVA